MGPRPTAAADKTPAPSGSSTTTTAAAPSPTTTGAPARDASADLVIWSDADRAGPLKKYADQFGQENGIKVAVQVVTDTRQQFKDATNVGKGPDVIVGAHDWLGELVQNGTVAPVPLAADVAAKFDPKAIAATKYNGQEYGVPYAVENIALMRNTALAPERPEDHGRARRHRREDQEGQQEGHATSSSSRSARSATPTTPTPT